MKREEAIAPLKEIAFSHVLQPIWVSMENKDSDGYELHIKSEILDQNGLRHIVEKHKLALREVKGILVIYRESKVLSNPEL